MWCFKARRQIIWALEEGHREPSGALLAHLENCKNCQGEMKRLRNLMAELRSIPHAVAPEGMWPLIQSEISKTKALGGGKPASVLQFIRWRPFPVPAIAGAMVMVLIAALISFYPFRFFSPQLVSAELDLSGYISSSVPSSQEAWLQPAEGFQPIAKDALSRTHSFPIYQPETIAAQFKLRYIGVRKVGRHKAVQLTYSNGVEGLSVFEVSQDVKLNFGAVDSFECELNSRHCRKMRTVDCVLTFMAGGTQFVLCTRNHDMKFLAQVVREFTERYSSR